MSLKDDEVEYVSNNNEDNETDFNTVIGCIEDMSLNEEFQDIQKKILDKYWKQFEDNEENKLIYMDIFEEYQTEVELYIENYLKKNISGFCMDTFIQELINRRDNLDGEIFEMLFTLSDFLTFKEMVLDYKAMKEGKTIDFSDHISVTKISLQYED